MRLSFLVQCCLKAGVPLASGLCSHFCNMHTHCFSPADPHWGEESHTTTAFQHSNIPHYKPADSSSSEDIPKVMTFPSSALPLRLAMHGCCAMSQTGPPASHLKPNIIKTKITASSPITSWQVKGEKVEAVIVFLFLGSKISADGNCSHDTRRWLLLGQKAITNLDNVLKNKDIILPTKLYIIKDMVFPVVIYECESWTINKVACQRIDAFKLWC